MSRRSANRPTPRCGEFQPRRSARIQQQREQPSVNPIRRERTIDEAKITNENVTMKKRKREDKDEDAEQRNCSSGLTAKKRSLRSNTTSETESSTKGNTIVTVKRGVRFSHDDALEELSDDRVAEESAAEAAALSVSAEFLANRPENAPYVALSSREMPCPPDAVAGMAPTRTLDSKGSVLLQYPIRFVLAYRIEVGALYRYLKSVKRDFFDFQGTLLAFQLRIDEGLNMRHDHGLSEVVYMGRRIWTMIMSQSDRPETLPYPTQRIRKFQEIMGCTSQPRVYPSQPMAHRLKYAKK